MPTWWPVPSPAHSGPCYHLSAQPPTAHPLQRAPGTGQHNQAAPLKGNIFQDLSQTSHSVVCPPTKQRIGCTKLPSDPADAGARPSEDNHVYPRGQPRLPQRLCTPPRSRWETVSVPSMALRLPALLALLRWQSARSAAGYSQHTVINVAGNSLAQCPERF